jgi:GTP-binding protein
MSASSPAHAFRVVLVGRPNVGKSALFNRLAGSRRALVHDRPGMTRDALEMPAKTSGGRAYVLVDTGGLDLDAAGGFAAWTSERALLTVADADLLLLVLDGAAGLLPEDRRIAARLHSLGKSVVAVWNKMDTRAAAEAAAEAHELGFRDVVEVSALHGAGQDELDALIEARLPAAADEEAAAEPLPVAVVGRPNVGKSSLVNALLGRDRVMVSEIPGTTRDAIDIVLSRGGRRYLFVDTAGIRRKGKPSEAPEKLAVVAALKSIERARICVIVFDASEGVTAQDATIAGYAEQAGRAMLLVANKWDLVEKDHARVKELKETVAERFVFARRAPFLPISAKTGRGVARVFPELDGLAKRFEAKITTGELNRVLQKAFARQSPTGRSGRDLRIRYAVQVRSGPPVIRLFADRAEALHFSFERYLQNRVRELMKLDGIPLKFEVRKSD